jgi:DNA replication and repair protein RecF
MPLTRLEITDFRNIETIKLNLCARGFNFFYGLNGSGKTSLLEAIYYLSLGRSFRTSLATRIIRHNTEKFVIFSQLSLADQSIPVGVERSLQGDIKIRISGKDIHSAVELADLTPVQLINSSCYNLLDAGPAFRRRYLDWGIFYLNKDFLRTWKDYGQILKQRNSALRENKSKKEIDAWTLGLTQQCALLDAYRKDYVAKLTPLLEETVSELLDLHDLKIHYYPGWDKSQNYADLLTQVLAKDMQIGHTQFGPHRADFKITINKVSAKDILSRGQQKLFVCAMILAQGELLNRGLQKRPLYLIDDLPAELDKLSRGKLVKLLAKQDTQIFMTAVEKAALDDIITTPTFKMFHVEHGRVVEDVQTMEEFNP